MNDRVLVFLCTVLLTSILSACNKNDVEDKLAEEARALDDYIAEKYGDKAIKFGGGAYLIKTYEDEEGAIIEASNHILWNWSLVNHITKMPEYTSDFTSVKFPKSYVDGGPEIYPVLSTILDKGLVLMRKGERGRIYIPSSLLNRDFHPRVYSFDIVDVIDDLKKYQEDLMYGYIEKKCKGAVADTIPKVVSTADNKEHNVMYHIMEQGDGDAITNSMSIQTTTTVSYMIRDDDVRSVVPVVVPDNTWTTGGTFTTLTKTNCVGEILTKMNKGGKVVVGMPSRLFWEDDKLPLNDVYQYYIPKLSVVIFTITIK